jgi:D-glycero-D-manno-heptose 1,7-bisphosphate phosphatase
MLKPAAFLDRDGVINKDKEYVYKIKDFEWIEGSQESIKFLNENNYHVFVVSNQSGIAKGLYSEKDVLHLHKFISKELKKIDAYIDEFFISPYDPMFPSKFKNLAHLRKPRPGMLEIAESKWRIEKKNSFLIGDKLSDIECAINYGIRGHLFINGNLLDFIKSSESI